MGIFIYGCSEHCQKCADVQSWIAFCGIVRVRRYSEVHRSLKNRTVYCMIPHPTFLKMYQNSESFVSFGSTSPYMRTMQSTTLLVMRIAHNLIPSFGLVASWPVQLKPQTPYEKSKRTERCRLVTDSIAVSCRSCAHPFMSTPIRQKQSTIMP
jgi:hypothetical protein